MTDKVKNIIKLLIRIAITAGLLTWVFYKIPIDQLWQAAKAAKPQYLLAVWLVTIIIFWIESVKMHLILKKQDCDVSVAKIFGASTVTSLYSLIAPGLLSTGAKWYILKKHTGKGTNIFSAMVYNQISAMVVLMVFGLTALIISNPAAVLLPNTKNRYILPLFCAILLAVVILASALLLNTRTAGKAIKAISYILRPLPAKLREKAALTLQQITVFQTVGWWFHFIIILFTIVCHLICGVIIYIFAAGAAGIKVPVTVLIWQCCVIYLLGRLPISVANLGVRELTLVESLALYGVEAPAALLMSIVIFSVTILMAVIGLAYQSAWAIGTKKTTQ